MPPVDKQLHALATYCLCHAAFGFVESVWIACAIALAIGAIKEISDRHNSFKENLLDMAANSTGAVAFLLIVFLHRIFQTHLS